MKITGAIIAGGQSRRMEEREKAFLPLVGKPILFHVIGRVGPQVDQLAINANGDPTRFAQFGLAVVPDVLTTLTTPLAGLHASLAYAKNSDAEVLVTVPSDTPFLPTNLVARLLENILATGAAIASSGEQDHFIVGAWRVSLLGELERVIAEENIFRVQDWARKLSAARVEWPTHPIDPFFNVNTPGDLQIAEQIASPG